jgi:hypothetical protein
VNCYEYVNINIKPFDNWGVGKNQREGRGKLLAIKDDELERINWAIDQLALQFAELSKRKQELELKRQERYLYIIK